MMSFLQAILLGLLQGVTELFPISSLGHSVLLPGIVGWQVDRDANAFLSFLVATHFATAVVLFWIYRRDWGRILAGLWRSLRARAIPAADQDAKLAWLLVVSTVPAGLLGLAFEKKVRALFVAPRSAALFLALNGLLLLVAEWLRRRAKPGAEPDADARIAAELSWGQALRVGLMQILALIPGFSRTGSTIAGGLLVGLSHEDALRYAFLLATPIIGAAALLKLPRLLVSADSAFLAVTLAGTLAAAVAAYASARFLARYFRTRTLIPFAIYCLAAGAAGLLLVPR